MNYPFPHQRRVLRSYFAKFVFWLFPITVVCRSQNRRSRQAIARNRRVIKNLEQSISWNSALTMADVWPSVSNLPCIHNTFDSKCAWCQTHPEFYLEREAK